MSFLADPKPSYELEVIALTDYINGLGSGQIVQTDDVISMPPWLSSLEGKNLERLDAIFTTPPIFDESYYGQVIHEIREMQIVDMGQYAHGNQPIQHMIYLYNYAGQPWKAQAHLRDVMRRLGILSEEMA